MAQNKWTSGLLLMLLAVIFSIGLTFASIEGPELLNKALYGKVPALDGDSHADESAVARTELFINHYHLRLIGYICFGVMVLLIAAGFITGKKGLASAGALLMFLPVFAQFAAVMFFLAGLGVLNVMWMPVLDISFGAGQWGDIVYLPYRLLRSLFLKIGFDVHTPLVYFLIGTGLLLFIIGTYTWFVSRQRKKDMADFWVYRISRHPQYLGWIIWSYGMLLALMRVNYPKRSWGIAASLPWMLSAMIIIGVALLEERKMKKQLGNHYEKYRKKTPFLFPLPKFLSKPFALPTRLLFKKKFPQRKGEIAVVLSIYTLLLVGLSSIYVRSRALPKIPDEIQVTASESRAEMYIRTLRLTDNWHFRRHYVAGLEKLGEQSVDPLITLLKDPDPSLRQIAASVLGKIESPRATDALIESLSDKNSNVRMDAAGALGKIGAEKAVEPLMHLLKDESDPVIFVTATALGRIGSERAVGPLIRSLGQPNNWNRKAVVTALWNIGSEKAVGPLLDLLEEENLNASVKREIMVAFLKIGSPKTESALKKALNDEDAEVRIYAREALKRLEEAKKRKQLSLKERIPVKDMQEDFLQFRNHIEEIHPQPYEFTSKKDFDKAFEDQYRQISRPLTLREFYNVLAPLKAKIGCGHAHLDYPGEYRRNVQVHKFPLILKFFYNRCYASKDLNENSSLPLYSEILAINKMNIDRIIETLKADLSADGHNESFKTSNLEKCFQYYYANHYGIPKKFQIKYRAKENGDTQRITIPAIPCSSINYSNKVPKDLSIDIRQEKDAAVLTIDSFIYYEEKNKIFFSFIDKTFEKIRQENIHNLIMDLRGNGGGDPFCASYLLSYIEKEPTVYFSKPYGKYADLSKPIPLAENPYRGNLFILTDGSNFSTTGHFCSLLKYHDLGTFIGQETGGTYTCNAAVRTFDLKNTGIILKLATGTFAAAVSGFPKDRGIIPHHKVQQNSKI
jgi:HEAT repeat protein/protein-S-isoprenylcysteine O-methyltransferase Ste14